MKPVVTVALSAFALGAVFAYIAAVLDLHGWLLHAFARILRAQWFTPAQRCPRCGREVHLLRHHPERAGAWGLADLGDRCLMCSGPEGSLRRPRSGHTAPDRTETAQGVGLGVLGWPQDAPGHSGTPAGTTTTEEERHDADPNSGHHR